MNKMCGWFQLSQCWYYGKTIKTGKKSIKTPREIDWNKAGVDWTDQHLSCTSFDYKLLKYGSGKVPFKLFFEGGKLMYNKIKEKSVQGNLWRKLLSEDENIKNIPILDDKIIKQRK